MLKSNMDNGMESWLFREGPFGKKGFFSLFTLTMSF